MGRRTTAGTRQPRRQTAVDLLRKSEPGLYSDGGGLYLQVTAAKAGPGEQPRVTRSWVFRYKANGKAREMGLGPLHTIPLADARQKAQDCRQLRLAGKDPIEERKAQRLTEQLEAARSRTFRQCAETYIGAHESTWKSAKHAAQWASTLEAYVYPIFGDLSVQAIDVGLVTRALEQQVPAERGYPAGPLWKARPETGSRVRSRIEAVLDWATARELRTGDNPARWRGRLEYLLRDPAQIRQVKNHPALKFQEVGAFMGKLRTEPGNASRALEFTILTAARTNEVIAAQWSEFDLAAGVWTVPVARMKAKKEHRVPLSKPALGVVRELHKTRTGVFVFPGRDGRKPLSNMAMLKVLERMGHSDITVHGFRSTFRDWAAEQTNFPHEVAEQALAHTIPNAVERAYRRGTLFDKRRKLMDEWGRYCGTATVARRNNVVPIRGRGRR